MRLVQLKVNGFRGFATPYEFDLDADAVVVVGANGNGKTSLFDAILWCLSGRVPRLGTGSERQVVSLYSETGHARAELVLRSATLSEVSVTRSFDGRESHLTLRNGSERFEGRSAETRLIELMWPEAAASLDANDALANVLTRCMYLQQDLVRHFVEAASDEERFSAVSELVGAGRVNELQISMESEKKAWTRATNEQKEQLNSLRDALKRLEVRLTDIRAAKESAAGQNLSDEWASWSKELEVEGLGLDAKGPGDREAAGAIDLVLKQLASRQLSVARRSQMLAALQSDLLGETAKPSGDITKLRERVRELSEEVERRRAAVSDAQQTVAERRKLQAALKDKNEQLRALASLALQHLGDVCPVCSQEYDRVATISHLEAIVREDGAVPELKGESEVGKSLSDLAESERVFGAAEAELRTFESAAKRWDSTRELLDRRLAEAGVQGEPHHRLALVQDARAASDKALTRMEELQRDGERISLQVAQASAAAAYEETLAEVERMRKDTSIIENAIAHRTRTGDLAQRVIEALREASGEVVAAQLTQIEPVLQGMYARIDPHPAFKSIRLLSRVAKGRGKLSAEIADSLEGKSSPSPAVILSSSQLNALAVCVFLALSVGVAKTPLSSLLLDDPLQSLDDINLLGLMDLLRRVRGLRQLCVSTHDARFGQLLARKLRPATPRGRTIVIELTGWSRKGPAVAISEIGSDPVAMRLVAS